jgi:hypothetical protein
MTSLPHFLVARAEPSKPSEPRQYATITRRPPCVSWRARVRIAREPSLSTVRERPLGSGGGVTTAAFGFAERVAFEAGDPVPLLDGAILAADVVED